MQNDTLYNRIMNEVDELIEGGGSGGDHVTITPALSAGTKVADYSINDTTGAIYAPAIPSGLATETYVDNAVSAATADLASETYVDTEIESATSGLASETYVNNAVAGLASVSYVNSAVQEEVESAVEDLDYSKVTISPALATGTKVADYSIDGTSGSLYAPTIPSGLATESWTTTQITNATSDKITAADLKIATATSTNTLTLQPNGSGWLLFPLPPNNGRYLALSSYKYEGSLKSYVFPYAFYPTTTGFTLALKSSNQSETITLTGEITYLYI